MYQAMRRALHLPTFVQYSLDCSLIPCSCQWYLDTSRWLHSFLSYPNHSSETSGPLLSFCQTVALTFSLASHREPRWRRDYIQRSSLGHLAPQVPCCKYAMPFCLRTSAWSLLDPALSCLSHLLMTSAWLFLMNWSYIRYRRRQFSQWNCTRPYVSSSPPSFQPASRKQERKCWGFTSCLAARMAFHNRLKEAVHCCTHPILCGRFYL